MCSLFSNFTLFYFILEIIATINVWKFLFPCYIWHLLTSCIIGLFLCCHLLYLIIYLVSTINDDFYSVLYWIWLYIRCLNSMFTPPYRTNKSFVLPYLHCQYFPLHILQFGIVFKLFFNVAQSFWMDEFLCEI